MTHSLFILLDGDYSFYAVAVFSIVGFAAGFVIRTTVAAKQKKTILKLEDQMLKNHSRILNLEATVGDLKSENAELKSGSRKSSLKVS